MRKYQKAIYQADFFFTITSHIVFGRSLNIPNVCTYLGTQFYPVLYVISSSIHICIHRHTYTLLQEKPQYAKCVHKVCMCGCVYIHIIPSSIYIYTHSHIYILLEEKPQNAKYVHKVCMCSCVYIRMELDIIFTTG